MTSVKQPPRRSCLSWINRKASRPSSPYRRADRWGGYLAVIKKTQGLKVALLDRPERILDRLVFYDGDSRPMAKHLTDEERPRYLREIKQDISYFKKSYTRADLQVSIEDRDVEQAAHHLLAQLQAYRPA